MKYKAIIFDMDGVLIDTEKLHFKAYHEVLAALGYHLSVQFYNDHFRSKGRKIGLKKLNASCDDAFIELVGSKKDQLYKEYLQSGEIDFYRDAELVINKCMADGIPIALGTASSMGKFVAEIIGLTKIFDVIITASDVTNSKPAPDIFLECANKLNVSGDVLVIEDSISGVEAALSANMDVVYIKREDNPKLPDEYCDHGRVITMEDLGDMIDEKGNWNI